jgi:hypothetical protein
MDWMTGDSNTRELLLAKDFHPSAGLSYIWSWKILRGLCLTRAHYGVVKPSHCTALLRNWIGSLIPRPLHRPLDAAPSLMGAGCKVALHLPFAVFHLTRKGRMRLFLSWTSVRLAAVGFSCFASDVTAADVRKYAFPPPKDLKCADIYSVETVTDPKAVLVLCPGCNGNGAEFVREAVWQRFAAENDIGLLGLSFSSDESLLTRGCGYYCASQGSGDVLLCAVRQIYGRRLPLLLFGFSGGAHFTSRFVEWRPSEVLGWCAYSAGWWDSPLKLPAAPPGVVACGENDVARYGPSLEYFLQGRALGRPWAWVSIAKTGHVRSRDLESFVRSYFVAILSTSSPTDNLRRLQSNWQDNDTKERVTEVDATKSPAITSWLPNEVVAAQWRQLHQP